MVKEKYILTGDVHFGEQYKITDSEIDYEYENNKSDKQKICDLLNKLVDENKQLQSEKENLKITIDEKILKAQTDVEDLKKDAYEKGYSFNPYFYWGIEIGLQRLKEELFEK